MGQSQDKHTQEDTDIRIHLGELQKERTDVSYNVSEFLRKHTDPEWIVKVDSFTKLLDQKVHIDPTLPKYAHIYNGIDTIISRIVKCLIRINPDIFEGSILHRTGSASSGVKVGLPHEADYMIELRHDNQPDYLRLTVKTFNEIIEIILNTKKKAIMAGLKHWNIVGSYRHRVVGLCLIMRCPSVSNQCDSEKVGVTVDIVPVYPAGTDGMEFTPTAATLLSRDLESCVQSDMVFQLIGVDKIDTGMIENEFLKDMSVEQKRAFRVVKYLFQTFIIRYTVFDFNDKTLVDVIHKMFGYRPIVRSYWLRVFLLLLLQHTHTELQRLNS